MCGHIGMASSYILGAKGGKFMTQGLYVDQLRGVDSTGLALVDKDNNVEIYKRALPASDFIHTTMGQIALNQAEKSFVALGHNRASTVGVTNNHTAHPFEFGRFVGAHNGTISQYYERDMLPVSTHSVDSMNLMASFNKEGNLHSVLRRIHTGSYAVVVYDKETEQLLFARNDQRPLHILQNKNNILWASEEGMLMWIASRNGYLDKDTNFIDVPTEQVLSFDCNDMTFGKPHKYTTVSRPYNYNNHHGQVHGGQLPPRNKSGATPTGPKKSGIRKGEFRGVSYDLNLSRTEIEEVLGLNPNYAKFIPYSFIPHGNNSNSRGRLEGYILDDTDGALFPATIYSIKEELYQDSMADGKMIIVEIATGNFTKDGNVVCLIGCNPTLAGEDVKDSIWDTKYLFIWEEEWEAGKAGSVLHETFVENLKDSNIKKAYRIKEKNQIVTSHTLKTIDASSSSNNKGKKENKKENKKEVKEVDGKKVVMLPPPTEGCKKSSSGTDSLEPQESTNQPSTNDEESFRSIPGGFVPGPDGPVSEKHFSILTQGGCTVCSDYVCVEDAPVTMWIHGVGWGYAPVCYGCQSPTILENIGLDPNELVNPLGCDRKAV